ncbi:solute carrier family 52, riboflavin transporter, member 3-B-like [Asterias amurensis]|uniref:solute carrier family 52, riboflavin transporter, member 3-B-like n=1 Tax=Asterias amurensis TaxID=7602 RepID=UPI003AB3CFB8
MVEERSPLLATTKAVMESSKSPLKVRIPVIVMTVLFGTGAWIAINGLWVELPLLVSLNIPENYNLTSYLTVIIQLANIGPLTFSLLNYFLATEKRIEIPTVFIIVTVGCIASFLLIIFWDSYSVWPTDNKLHSTALLVLAFFLSLVDCTSSVTFTPFMSLLKESYLMWYFIGEGLSSLLPSVVALIQGVGGQECVANGTYINRTVMDNVTVLLNCTNWIGRDSEARFPPEDFFGFLLAMMITCGIAFTLLNYLPLAKQEHIPALPPSKTPTVEDSESSNRSSDSHNMLVCSSDTRIAGGDGPVPVPQEDEGDDESDQATFQTVHILTRLEYIYLFVLLAIVCAISNGILPSIQTYSCAPYGLNTYLLAATLGKIANPVGAFAVLLFPCTSLSILGASTLAGVLVSAYCILTASLSPTPPLQHEVVGDVLIILAWILMNTCFGYSKSLIAWILRTQPKSRKLLIWYGGITQVGSMIGSFTMWPLINIVNVFQPYYENVCYGYPECQTPQIPVAYRNSDLYV